jgi:hypothetical protein
VGRRGRDRMVGWIYNYLCLGGLGICHGDNELDYDLLFRGSGYLPWNQWTWLWLVV